MSGTFFRLVCSLLFLSFTSSAAAKTAEGKHRAFLRQQGFGMNYGLVSNTDAEPNPPEFHLGLEVPRIFTVGESSTGPRAAAYVQKTIEKVFGRLVGTSEPETPFAMPSYHLVNRSAH